MADDQYVELSDDELAAWRAQHPGRDRPRIVTGRAEFTLRISTASDEAAPPDPA